MVANTRLLTQTTREDRMINSFKTAALGAAMAFGLVGTASAQ